jgi:hypothetical protein
MGETNALLPVMHELQIREVDFKVMAMGAAVDKLVSDASLNGKIIEIKESVDTARDRCKPLKDVAGIIEDLQPLLVISGAASKAQEQLLEALPAKRKIVYLDSFNYVPSNISFETVKGVVRVSQKIICITAIVKEQVMFIENSTLKGRDIKVLGRPSLENWVRQVQEVDKFEVLKKVGFDEREKIVTFIGGYGAQYDAGVNDAFESAMKCLKSCGYQVHMQYHPNIVKTQPLTTVEAVGMADCVVCYDSTVGFEALFAGKRVIYLQPEKVTPYDNIAIEKDLADRVQTNEQLLEALESPSTRTKDVYKVLGVEKKSTEKITNYILKKLKKFSE